jgi:hydrogenase maturation factor HypE
VEFLLIAAEPQFTPRIVDTLQQAGIRASVIGRVQTAEKERVLVSQAGSRPLPTFARDEITRLFE